MRLALSSAAAPAASLGELLEAAARRGLAAVELVEGHGHGIDPGLSRVDDAASAARRAADAGVALSGFRLSAASTERYDAGLVPFAQALRAPLLVPYDGTDGTAWTGGADAEWGPAGANRAVVVLPASDPLTALASLHPEQPVAWTADPGAGELAAKGDALVRKAGPRLRHIVLRGGGPEATEQQGRGVGSLMARLAVSGYAGTLALAPSSPRYRVIWDAWLGRRGGWGCGSKSEDRSLVSLGGGA